MSARTQHKSGSRDALRSAVVFHALAQGFLWPESGHKARVASKLAAANWPWPGRARDLNALRRAWRAASEAMLRDEYGRLFAAGGPCSPHETAYGDGRRIAGRAHELADIGGFYAAFGLTPSTANPDLPDHIGAELEFYSLLLVKQAYARSRGRRGDLRVARDAGRLFIEQHLGRWAGALAQSMTHASAASPYRELARALAAAVAAECRHLRTRSAPVEGTPPFDEMQADAFTCPLESPGIPRGAGKEPRRSPLAR
ncbi:MAG: molecular chaperone TorD family protein [Betaproteobacteria bacterium]|nr:molecular chaperone TorD family protein [Betaproteobacteria bacterium]